MEWVKPSLYLEQRSQFASYVGQLTEGYRAPGASTKLFTILADVYFVQVYTRQCWGKLFSRVLKTF